MPMIDEAEVSAPDSVREEISAAAWVWYYKHHDVVVFSQRVLFWKVTVCVRDLRPLFVLLFGDQ